MNYKETCDYLYSQVPMFERQGASGYKEGLANTLKLDDHFNHPHQNYRTIHVAGTNGKGSCAHTLAAILQMCGYKVGLYTSPHLVDFSERIRINGQPIDEDYVINFVEKEKGFFEPLSPSFFEVVTAMAFKYFADKKVDFAVILQWRRQVSSNKIYLLSLAKRLQRLKWCLKPLPQRCMPPSRLQKKRKK